MGLQWAWSLLSLIHSYRRVLSLGQLPHRRPGDPQAAHARPRPDAPARCCCRLGLVQPGGCCQGLRGWVRRPPPWATSRSGAVSCSGLADNTRISAQPESSWASSSHTLRAHTVDFNQVESRVSSKWEFVTQVPHLPISGKGRAQRHPSCHLTENSACPGSIFHHIVKTSLLNAQLHP